ncbi:monovalent cation/H+ antiporter subunit D [Ramlibacter tataouinensis]|uniref:Candidate formate hydrogenlyase, MnhD subunit n=1 Tax=Ramlibacter tataouinensis (strain ATCC BAA-407 / DSM 14655 / LMG 21543 / TTB310) TaxID=365046 RepID=F5XWC3_RAMTT|nr:monovalent cation/H+ antiporter subunit D [Ramlibacter tataouinensis]AEG91693.1 Candidate formate hydrogenlyase, MnhD subunit [Ramlibacter tataouinensis TTB310]
MSQVAQHLIIAPVIVPLLAGALLLVIDEPRHTLKASVSLAAVLVLLTVAAALVAQADAPVTHVYSLGAWAAPLGIVLVADRLAAAMVLLTSLLGLAALLFSVARWHRAGPQFHSLVQFLLAGLNGAFLTGDLFNLFVFFELLLAASYGLALHGSGAPRVRAGLHYIVINLAASLLFLVGVSLLYGMAGTLNMADLAVRLPQLPAEDRPLLEVGAATLAVAFLVKAGMWPLGFWLPATYSSSSAPAAALFCILSKVGIYAVLRIWFVVFGDGPGAELIAYGGLATLVFGMVGMLGSQDLGRIASFSLVVSSGTLLAAIGVGGPAAVAPALFYLVTSTLGTAALFLLVELVQRSRAPGADLLAVTADAFRLEGEDDEPEELVGVLIPASMAVLGLAFACASLQIAGLPPLPGFVAKFSIMASVLDAGTVSGGAWVLLTLVMLSGLAALIALGRGGVRVFWAGSDRTVPRVRLIEVVPVAGLIAVCLVLTVFAGPAMTYMQDAVDALHPADGYIREVLEAP